jgi:hypothetical protein
MANRRVVWVLSHFEFLGRPSRLDEVVLHVATTKAAALRHVKSTHIDPGTWWGLQPFRIDDRGFWRPQVLYSRTGRVMKRGYSQKRALRLGLKVRARNAARFRAWQKKEGGTEHPPSRPF